MTQEAHFSATEERTDIFCGRIDRFLRANRSTIAESLPIIRPMKDPFWHRSAIPSIQELEPTFREAAVDLTVGASRKALNDAKLKPEDITHVVATYGTVNIDQPGFHNLVAQALGVHPYAERVLITGSGCAGGVASIRTAAAAAQSSAIRCKPAHILCLACELSSVHAHCELSVLAGHHEDRRNAPHIFGDGASAFVLSNALGLEIGGHEVAYEVVD